MSFGGLSFVAAAVVALVSSIAVARIYGVAVMGQYALALAPLTMVVALSTVREQVALVRELSTLSPRTPMVTGLFTAVLTFSSVLTLLVAAAVTVISYFLFHGPIGHPEIFPSAVVLLAAYVLIQNPSWNFDAVFSAFRAGRQLFWIRLWQAVSYLVLAVGIGLVSRTLWAITLATAASWFAALVPRAVTARAFVRWRVPRETIVDGFKALPRLVRWGLKLAPWGAVMGIGNEFGVWVLGAVAPLSAVGAYSRAWLLGSRFFDLTTRVSEMLFPTLVERRTAGDVSGFDRAFIDTVRYSAAALLLPAAAGGGAAHGVMELFGPGFSQGADALVIILLVPVLATVSGIQAHTLFVIDRALTVSGIALARLVTILSLSFVLTIEVGIVGTATAIAIGYTVDVALGSRVTGRYLKTPVSVLWRYREMAALLLAYGLGFITAHSIDTAVEGALGTLVALAGGSAAYIVIVAAGAVNRRDRERLSSSLRARRR
ncbi:MAG: oligosaccharide flippase family protein [Actinobacteria bacterium]|nr:oligosaccharide flippase family protein [Actinomycetota bacterium]